MKTWKLLPSAPEEFFSQNRQYPKAISQLLFNRQLVSETDIKYFFDAQYLIENHDPFLFRDMTAAVELIVSHIKRGHKIIICGDYDADGVTASSIMSEILDIFKAKVEVWIPSRTGEGYGLNKNIIKEFADSGARLLITVDNGIRSQVEVAYAKELNIDVIVTDHHECLHDNELPDCLIIDPILKTETYPFKFLCGAGVAYKLAKALIRRSLLSDDDKERLAGRLIDLAAIGTIGDCVSLLGENRLLVKHGLDLINRRPRLGIAELVKAAQINNSLNSWNIGWQIVPRLNVAGRLDHANTAYQLLISQSPIEAQALALQLNERNIDRQKITEEIVNYCHDLIKKEQLEDKMLVLKAPNLDDAALPPWPEGVVGLVAGRLCEAYSRPVLVICESEGKIKGSGRSVDDYHITESLEYSKEFLERFGGHKLACGFTVKSLGELPKFIKAQKALAQKELANVNMDPVLKVEAELPLTEATEDLMKVLEKFAPYGQNNPQPKFLAYNVFVQDVVTMGAENQHIKLRLNGLWAIAFGQAKEWGRLQISDVIDLVYALDWNEFNGRKTLQLKIIDLKKHD